jgi:hypothetical protein
LDSLASELAPALRSGFLLSGGELEFDPRFEIVGMKTDLLCEGGIRIQVEEHHRFVRMGWLGPRDAAELIYYRYNVVLNNVGTIFRYNSPHEDHRQFHHVHRIDVLGSGAETVLPLKEREVPTLREVLQESERWHYDHLDRSTGNG